MGLLLREKQAHRKTTCRYKLVALCVQHAIFRCITEDIRDTAAKSIHRTIDPIIDGMAQWV
jgi:hypothetical protein